MNVFIFIIYDISNNNKVWLHDNASTLWGLLHVSVHDEDNILQLAERQWSGQTENESPLAAAVFMPCYSTNHPFIWTLPAGLGLWGLGLI